jgi:hypothetical protein
MTFKFIDYRQDSMNLTLPDLPHLKKQRRKTQAKSSLSLDKIMGADTETVNGRVWLFSTEKGVWEIDSMQDLIEVLFNEEHSSTWKQGRGKNQKTSRGLSTKEFFFYNLKFDAQAFLKLMSDDEVLSILEGKETLVQCGEGQVKVKYLEGKFMSFKPVMMYRGQWKLGKCIMWDISQFYTKMRLNHASQLFLGESKIEVCFDGSKLDVTKLNDPEYRDFYREDIEKYAIKDAVLAGRLARMCRDDMVANGVRFIQPYSVANIAQRNMMDLCKIPTLNNFQKHPQGLDIIHKSLASYRGGWFSTSGSGRFDDCVGVDLVSAYPYIMWNLQDITKGVWIQGSCSESWWNWVESREAYSMGYAEVFVEFEKGLPFYPLVAKTKKGTMAGARIVKGWFTADEIAEAKKWPHVKFIVGEWIKFEGEEVYPFRPFLETFYSMKKSSEKDSVPYRIAKLLCNSGYGKLIQCIDGNIGTLYNPMCAAMCTGGTRARLAEIIRLNDYSALSIATDGVIFPRKKLKVIPPRPREALLDLGNWEIEVDGDLLVQKSGVYSMQNKTKCKTVFRGNASYFLKDYQDGGLFRFCDEHASEMFVQMEVTRPLSAKQARMKSNLDLINIFTPQIETMTAFVLSDKRRWKERPKNFEELSSRWWPSLPLERLT